MKQTLLIAIALWFLFLGTSHSVRIGDGFQDYLVLKALAAQLMENPLSANEIWHPFLLPALLLGISAKLVPQGPDYLVYLSLLATALLIFLWHPLKHRVSTHLALVVLVITWALIAWPGPHVVPLAEAREFSFAVSYNRYMDVFWVAPLLLFFIQPHKGSNPLPDFALATFILLVAFFTKLSYFLVFLAVFLVMLFIRQERKWLIPIGIVGVLATIYALGTHYLDANLEILQMKLKNPRPWVIEPRWLMTGLIMPALLPALFRIRYSFGLIWPALFFTGMMILAHRGNYGDLGFTPFFFLVVFYTHWLHQKSNGVEGFFRRFALLTFFSFACFHVANPSLSRGLYPVWVMIEDRIKNQSGQTLPEIPGFYLAQEYVDRHPNLASSCAGDSNAPKSVRIFSFAWSINDLIAARKSLGNIRVFANTYTSLFVDYAAGFPLGTDRRAWMMDREFSDRGERYRSQQRVKSQFSITPGCPLPSIERL